MTSCNNIDKDYAFDKVSKYINEDMKVACVPFASELHWQLNGDFKNYKEQHFRVFEKFGIKRKNIFIVKLSEGRESIIEKIDSADIVFFSGGYMENFMFIVKALRLEFFMKDYLVDKLIIGESAGTLVMLDSYAEVPFIEDDYKQYKRKDGLGYVNNLDIIVHYVKDNEHHKKNRALLEVVNVTMGKEVVCLTDNSLIIVNDDEIEFVGDYVKR
jgi:peptidase E